MSSRWGDVEADFEDDAIVRAAPRPTDRGRDISRASPPEAEGEEDPKEARARRIRAMEEGRKLQGFVEELFARDLRGTAVVDLASFRSRCEGLARAPGPGGLRVDGPLAAAALAEELLAAAARTLHTSRLGYLQQRLAEAEAPVSPALAAVSDLAVWRTRWPRLALPVFHGGGPSVSVPLASLRRWGRPVPARGGEFRRVGSGARPRTCQEF